MLSLARTIPTLSTANRAVREICTSCHFPIERRSVHLRKIQRSDKKKNSEYRRQNCIKQTEHITSKQLRHFQDRT